MVLYSCVRSVRKLLLLLNILNVSGKYAGSVLLLQLLILNVSGKYIGSVN